MKFGIEDCWGGEVGICWFVVVSKGEGWGCKLSQSLPCELMGPG